jgi:hypothetical protein
MSEGSVVIILIVSVTLFGGLVVFLATQYGKMRGHVRLFRNVIDIGVEGDRPRYSPPRRPPRTERLPDAGRVWLGLRDYPETVWRYNLDESRRYWVFGSDAACDIHLTHDSHAKPRHAALTFNGRVYQVQPIDGEVFVNSQRVQGQAPVNNGQEIRVGQTRFVFKANSGIRRR